MSMPSLNAGALAPVADECELIKLTVTGEIPRALNGTLVRNGPNPLNGRFEGEGVLSWWPEAAMLHGLTLADGEALEYRNRWVRSKNWGVFNEVQTANDLIDSNPNVSILQHGGNTLALAEGGAPALINQQLETLGATTGYGRYAAGMTAHPKLDPVTGELIVFRADWNAPWLRYGVIDAQGEVKLDMEIAVLAPAMMHDLAITETHSILLDLNVGYDFSMLQHGHRIPIRWQNERASRLGVIPRQGGEITWLDIEPCFIQHVVNAFDAADGSIVMDVARYPWYFRLDAGGKNFAADSLAVLWRYRIDLAQGSVSEEQLSDINLELPRINEQLTGRTNRYFYAVEQPTTEEMRGIVKYDLTESTTQHHRVAPGDQNSEPIFVPSQDGVTEDDGWLLVCIYRQHTATTEVRILDAQDITAPPLATIVLDRRIPAGFHGAWLPA